MNLAISHVLQSTVFAVFACLVNLTLLRKNSAQVRYGVWLAASVKFLIPFASLIALGARFGFMGLAAPETQATFYYAMDDVSRRVVPHFVPSAMPEGGNPLSVLLLILWGCGVAVVTANWFLRWCQVRALARAAMPLRMAEGVAVLSSPDRGFEPGVFGLLRPVILVPKGIAERLSAEQLDAILTHEICHVRRRDNIAAAVQMLVEALFWFHPLVWWLGRQLTL
jgi:beta-lactamase regulating signal transducer with metallopeptidase domain